MLRKIRNFDAAQTRNWALVPTRGAQAVSAGYTVVSGTIGAAVIKVRASFDGNTGLDYVPARQLDSSTTVVLMLDGAASPYILLELTTVNASTLLLDLFVELSE